MIHRPQKLLQGDEIRVIPAAKSLTILSEEIIKGATDYLKNLGFRVSFSENVREKDLMGSYFFIGL